LRPKSQRLSCCQWEGQDLMLSQICPWLVWREQKLHKQDPKSLLAEQTERSDGYTTIWDLKIKLFYYSNSKYCFNCIHKIFTFCFGPSAIGGISEIKESSANARKSHPPHKEKGWLYTCQSQQQWKHCPDELTNFKVEVFHRPIASVKGEDLKENKIYTLNVYTL